MYEALGNLHLICILLTHLFNKFTFLFPTDEGNKPSVSKACRMLDLTDVW